MKSFVTVLFIFIFGITAYGDSSTFNPTGDIEFGIDIYDFEESSSHKDYSEPYVRYNIYPIGGSPLSISGRSSYRDQYNTSGDYENDRRKRNQVYLAYQWRIGNLSLDPAIGFRADNFENSKFNERNEARFIPTVSYRFNRNLQWYFTGYIGYTDVDGEEVDNKGNVTEEYSNQSTRNLISGFRYRASNRLRLDAGVQHKKREAWSSHYFGTIYRTRVNYDIYRTRQWRLTINGQVAYMPEVEVSKQGHTEDDEMAYRLGFTLQRELTPNFDIIGKFYYQWRPQNEAGSGGGGGDGSGGGGNGGGGGSGSSNNNSGPNRSTEHEQFYSIAIRYYF